MLEYSLCSPYAKLVEKKVGMPIAVVDTIGAGPGEKVLYITAYEAVIPYHRDMVPIDAALIGIVDSSYVKK